MFFQTVSPYGRGIAAGTAAAWRTCLNDEVDTMGFKED